MPGRTGLPMRIARCYDLPLQVSSFFALLILSEYLTQESISSMGQVDIKVLAHRLRKALTGKNIEIRSRRTMGYWLDDDVRRQLATKFNIELGISI